MSIKALKLGMLLLGFFLKMITITGASNGLKMVKYNKSSDILQPSTKLRDVHQSTRVKVAAAGLLSR